MSKEIRFSDHALFKMDLLSERGMIIAQEFIIETIRFPDAQKQLNENLVLRVVYREYEAFMLVITLYPGRRSRYEKS